MDAVGSDDRVESIARPAFQRGLVRLTAPSVCRYYNESAIYAQYDHRPARAGLRENLELRELCSVNDVRPDQPYRAEVDGEVVAVFEIDGKYYVTQDLCTHGPGSLSEGYVDGEEIECPFHQGRFNILTGAPAMAPCTIPLKTWEVMVEGDRILVGKSRRPGSP
jgi:nitrite reductase/ring-hydroxylating ferredoxin subunit